MIEKIIFEELEKMKGFDQMNPNHCYDLYDHTMAVVAGVEQENDKELTLAAALHDIGKMSCFTEADGVRKFIGHAKASAEIARTLLIEAGYPDDSIERIVWLVAEHETDLSSTKSMKKRLESGGELQVRKLLKLRRADILGQAKEVQEEHLQKVDEAERILEDLIKQASGPKELGPKDLAVDARALMAMGYKGPEIGATQKTILAEIKAGKLQNTEESIMDYLSKRR